MSLKFGFELPQDTLVYEKLITGIKASSDAAGIVIVVLMPRVLNSIMTETSKMKMFAVNLTNGNPGVNRITVPVPSADYTEMAFLDVAIWVPRLNCYFCGSKALGPLVKSLKSVCWSVPVIIPKKGPFRHPKRKKKSNATRRRLIYPYVKFDKYNIKNKNYTHTICLLSFY